MATIFFFTKSRKRLRPQKVAIMQYLETFDSYNVYNEDKEIIDIDKCTLRCRKLIKGFTAKWTMAFKWLLMGSSDFCGLSF